MRKIFLLQNWQVNLGLCYINVLIYYNINLHSVERIIWSSHFVKTYRTNRSHFRDEIGMRCFTIGSVPLRSNWPKAMVKVFLIFKQYLYFLFKMVSLLGNGVMIPNSFLKMIQAYDRKLKTNKQKPPKNHHKTPKIRHRVLHHNPPTEV